MQQKSIKYTILSKVGLSLQRKLEKHCLDNSSLAIDKQNYLCQKPSILTLPLDSVINFIYIKQ